MTKDDIIKLAREAEPPAEWPLIKSILDEYGLDAIAFVAEWKAAQQQAEPVAWVCMNGEKHDIDFDQPEIDAIPVGTFLYTAPPQRQWQGLTPEEVKHLYPYGRSVWGRETFEAIEKALRSKNT